MTINQALIYLMLFALAVGVLSIFTSVAGFVTCANDRAQYILRRIAFVEISVLALTFLVVLVLIGTGLIRHHV
jgi:hypothetical protein